MAILIIKDKNGNEIPIPSIQGKSAYQYAVDGGYTGTEEEFSQMLANGANGLTQEQITALDNMFKKCAFIEDVSFEYEAFKIAFGLADSGEVEPDEPIEPDEPTITLTSISATYTGGNVVVGTSVNSLTGITVKATYSDGSAKNVTGYTLSGTIAGGSNTITVSYQGKTTTFVVVGVAEGGGETWEESMVLSYATSNTPNSSNSFVCTPTTNAGYNNACSTNEVEHYGGVLYVDLENTTLGFEMGVVLEDTNGTRCKAYEKNIVVASDNQQITSVPSFTDNISYLDNRNNGYSYSVVIPEGYKLACLYFRQMSSKADIIAQNGVTFTLKGV